MLSGNSTDKDAGKVKSTYFWEYTGSLRKAFRNQSEKMARQSNNTQRYASIQGGASGVYNVFQKTKPKDELFEPIQAVGATGANIGTRAKNYDFVYDESTGTSTISYSSKHPSKTGQVPERYVKQMNRYIQFDLFNGYAQYIKDTLEGRTSSSPEDYIASMTAGSRDVGAGNKRGVFNSSTGKYEQNLPMGIKLYYQRNGATQQRQMVQPYIRYYFKKVMVPLAKKLLNGQIK